MERKIILLWFKRFDTVNKGLLRILALLLVAATVFWLAILIDEKPELTTQVVFIVSFYVIGTYIGLILVFRILLWIYDGFRGK